jgi:hypothetical protein
MHYAAKTYGAVDADPSRVRLKERVDASLANLSD